MSRTHTKRKFVSLAVLAVCPCRLMRAQGLDPALFATALATHPEAIATPAPHPSLLALTQRASALGAAGRYDEQLDTLNYAAGLMLASVEAHPNPAGDLATADALFDLGLRLDGAGHPRDAVRILSLALQLVNRHAQASSYELFTLQLALAHAQARAGDTAAAAATCSAASTVRISTHELHQHRLGDRTLLDTRRQLFCGESQPALTTLNDEITAHPHRAEPHQLLAQYQLATGNWTEANRELQLWQNSPEIRNALPTVH